jgi:hypothetical protein
MLETSLQESWRVRHPWRQEMPRLAQHFGLHGLRRDTRRTWYWVLVAGDLERPVGVMELAEDAADHQRPPRARLEYSLRDAWAGGDGARQLLHAALRQAAELGLTFHTSQAHPESSYADLLREAGFVAKTPQEVWLCPVAAPVAKYEASVDRMLRRFPLKVTPLDAAHLETIRRMCVRLNLLPADRVALREPGQPEGGGFDPRFSFLAGDPANPSAFVLSRFTSGKLYLEVLARNPDFPRASPAAIAALLKALLPAARDHGIAEFSSVFRPTESAPVLALLRRGGGRCVRRFALFVLSPESKSP